MVILTKCFLQCSFLFCFVSFFCFSCVQAHFEQQEIVLVHCSGVCIFVGAKLVVLLRDHGELIISSPWSLNRTTNFASLATFSLFFDYVNNFCSNSNTLYDNLIPVHLICKCAWYVASGVQPRMEMEI